jgi:uncharacterized membrane protein YhaH (DUF805 family)
MNPFQLLFSFRGRIGRTAFWVCLVGVSIFMTATAATVAWAIDNMVRQGMVGPVSPHLTAFYLVGIPFLWPLMAVQVKRWHDLNRSGWWVLVNLVPMLGNMVSFVMCGLMPGTGGVNDYGPMPDGIFSVGT